MAVTMFGELFKKLRLKEGYTLREYCRKFDRDPAYISRIERGKVVPPTNPQTLERFALSLGLKDNSIEMREFIYSATISAGKIPQEIMSDKEVIEKLPLLLRTVHGQKLTDEQLDNLIEVIKRS